jgi:lipoyl(octanoyl) transferase
MNLRVLYAPQVPYAVALEAQNDLRSRRQREEIPDTLLLLEHPAVITLGKRGGEGDLLLPREKLAEHGVAIAEVDRGGQVTYHGPGQLVGYVIVNLYNHQRKLKRFIGRLEETLIRYLKEYHGIEAGLSEEHVGVWVGDEKIAALGISISRGVTMHGFALNLNCDLEPFGWIVPCGIRERGVTSVAQLRGEESDLDRARREYALSFADVYGYTIEEELTWEYPRNPVP